MRIVTVARFDQAGQAHVAKNALEAAGIRAVIADETVVSMDWFLSNAVGGIKVQVLEEDAERAVAALEAALGSEGEPLDEDALAAEAEAMSAEHPDEQPSASSGPPSGVFPSVATMVEPGRRVSERDQYARRFLLAALFGLVMPPLWFYAIYLFFTAVFGDGPLSERGGNRVAAGVFVMMAGAVVVLWTVWVYGIPLP